MYAWFAAFLKKALGRRRRATIAHPNIQILSLRIVSRNVALHLPLNRQTGVYEREGIDLDVSTLADWVGAAAATLMPLVDVIRSHVFAAERIHADDTRVPVLAKGTTGVGRLWTYVRDERRSAVPIRRRRCSSICVIVAASIPSNTWRATPD